MKIVTLFSGGLDSTTLVYHLKDLDHGQLLLSFNYGQRHRKELNAARKIAKLLDLPHYVVNLRSLATLLSGSALTDATIEVPEGSYTEDSIKLTIVPNRNAIFLAIAYGLAVAQGAEAVAIAVHGGDHPIYPDCGGKFLHRFESMEWAAIEDPFLQLLSPFTHAKKQDLVLLGTSLNVPYELTWSCYKGGKCHCGKCATCIERKEAFAFARIEDPTRYEEDAC